MGVRDVLLATDGGQRVHHECRDCGANLDDSVDQCPECGGEVASYDLP